MAVIERSSQERSGRALRAWARRIESDETLDSKAAPLEKAAAVISQSEPVHDLLRGKWLGHAVHPLLTDFPLGAWISTSLLDLFGGEQARRPAQGLVGFGVATAVPTALAGLADWSDTRGGARRVGTVHGAMNGGILACYAASWLARRSERHRLGVALALVGGITAWVSGYLGGHLSLVSNTGIANRERDSAGSTNVKDTMVAAEREGDGTEQEGESKPVVHGGKDDPLGGGVAHLEESSEVSEGVPDQGDDSAGSSS